MSLSPYKILLSIIRGEVGLDEKMRRMLSKDGKLGINCKLAGSVQDTKGLKHVKELL